MGTVYLLHFSKPYRHAKHYLGWTDDLDERLRQHRRGAGARLLAVVTSVGIRAELVRTWPNTTWADERKLKNWHSGVRLCPLCRKAHRQ